MQKQTIIKGLSANSVQLALNQLFGFVIFYVLSRDLGKSSFGELNWTLAVLLSTFNVLSFGIDQVIVKRIAEGGKTRLLLSLYVFHTLIGGLLFYGILLLASFIFPGFFVQHHLLLLIGIGKLMIFFSTPFKQLVTGMQKFNLLLYMSICSNVSRGLGLLIISLTGTVTLHEVIVIFIEGDLFDWLVCIALGRTQSNPGLKSWNREDYINLLRESWPQIGVVVFTTAIARFDWIFIGLFVSDVKLAEYSFAYKIFEVSTLPLLAIAPLLLPFFALFFKAAKERSIGAIGNLRLLFRAEMLMASLTALLLNLLWIPVIDPLTQGKYGLVNVHTILILSFCIPALYLNNFLWSIHFALGNLKQIFFIFAVTFCLNLAGDLALIPFFKNEGAAFAFILAVFVQSFLYLRKSRFEWFRGGWTPLVLCPVCAIVAGIASHDVFGSDWKMVPSTLFIFLLMLVATLQIRRSDFKKIAGMIKR